MIKNIKASAIRSVGAKSIESINALTFVNFNFGYFNRSILTFISCFKNMYLFAYRNDIFIRKKWENYRNNDPKNCYGINWIANNIEI